MIKELDLSEMKPYDLSLETLDLVQSHPYATYGAIKKRGLYALAGVYSVSLGCVATIASNAIFGLFKTLILGGVCLRYIAGGRTSRLQRLKINKLTNHILQHSANILKAPFASLTTLFGVIHPTLAEKGLEALSVQPVFYDYL